MDSKYTYHGIDITLDVYEKICSVVELMAEKEDKTFDECYLLFASSEVYELLQNEESLMWSESAEYLFDEYYRKQASPLRRGFAPNLAQPLRKV